MSDRVKGILYIVMAALFFALMGMFVRLAGDVPSVQKSFFRNIVALVIALVIMLKNKESFRPGKGNLKYLLARAACGTVGILGNFYAVDHLVLSDASMLNKMSPFSAIVFSWILLKEKLTLWQGLAVTGAFVGSLFIIKPTFSNMALVPSVCGLLGGIGAGLAYTCVRIMGKRGVSGAYIVFFFSAFSTLVVLPYVIVVHAPMTLMQLAYLLCAGLAAALGQLSITAAYCHAPAREISVYDYSQIIFSAILGFILFNQRPDALSIVGYVVICSMAVFMFFYNKRRDALQ